jgi:hypothetical protein
MHPFICNWAEDARGGGGRGVEAKDQRKTLRTLELRV